MKKISIKFFSIILCIVAIIACQNDDLPKANFSLNIVASFSGEIAHEKVDLAWQAPQSGTPQSYILNWSPGGETTTLNPSTTSYEIVGLDNGTKYKFNIQVDYGNGGISGKREVELQPQDELNFNVLPGNQLAIAVWETPSRSDISGYTVSWSPNGQEVTIDSGANVYQVTGLDNDVEYTFTFKVNYAGGGSSNNLEATITPGEIQAFLLSEEIPMANSEVQFTFNSAFLPQSTATSWSWNFGDGGNSTEENPAYTFATPGTYDVTIQITDDQGLTFNDTKTVQVWGQKWSFTTGADIRSSSPAIGDDGTIYVGSRDENLYAFNPDGTVKWTFATDNGIDASPSIGPDGTIYCGSYDDKMYAVNLDGTLKWEFLTGSNVRYSTPAITSDGSTIYFGSEDTKLYALNTSDGSVKWEFTSGDRIRSTPSIAADGTTVYATSNDNNLYALNSDNGATLWSFPMDGISEGGPSIDSDGTIFVGVDKGGSDGAIIAVNPDGTEKWNSNVLGRISVNVPIVANDRIYIGTKEGNNLLALNRSTGSQIWSFDVPGEIILSNPAVDVNGNIYFGAWNKGFYSIDADAQMRFGFECGRVWSSPVIGQDGTVYFGSYDDNFYALEMFAEGLANDVWPMFGKNLKHTSR